MDAHMDHYAALGVARDAETIVIRAAYKALSQRYHPDKCPPTDRAAAHRRMSEINQAFDVLGDPLRRRAYDEQRPMPGQSKPMADVAPAPRNGRLAPIGIVAGTVLLALLVAVEKKPWWEMTWEFVTSGLERPSAYAVNWPMLIVILCVGLRVAWMVRHKLREG